MPSTGRDASFDHLTDRTSHEIARRFAPASGEPQATAAERPAPSLSAPPVGEERVPRGEAPSCRRPPLGLLRRPQAAKAGGVLTQAEQRGQAQLLGEVLADFGVKGEIKDVHPGPVVTLYEFEPARGVKSARVVGLADDLARSMGAACVRAAAIPGRNAIGIELPNPRREKVLLRELLELGGVPHHRCRAAAGAGQEHLRHAGVRRPGAHAASAGGRHHRLGQVGRRQCHDPVAALPAVARAVPAADDRPQDAGAVGLQRHPASAVPGGDRTGQGGGGAATGSLREMEDRYRRMSLQAVRNIDAFNMRMRQSQKRGTRRPRPRTAGSGPRSRCPTSSSWSTSSPT